jgi:pentatricopeptide repeat protein
MELRRIPFDIYSFNILMKCFCSCHKLSFALSTFGKITKLGFHPDVVTFSTLIHGLCLEGRISEAVAFFIIWLKRDVLQMS